MAQICVALFRKGSKSTKKKVLLFCSAYLRSKKGITCPYFFRTATISWSVMARLPRSTSSANALSLLHSIWLDTRIFRFCPSVISSINALTVRLRQISSAVGDERRKHCIGPYPHTDRFQK